MLNIDNCFPNSDLDLAQHGQELVYHQHSAVTFCDEAVVGVSGGVRGEVLVVPRCTEQKGFNQCMLNHGFTTFYRCKINLMKYININNSKVNYYIYDLN